MDRPIIVLKVGTSSLIDTSTGVVQVSALARLAEAAIRLHKAGYYVIIVSSGAVGLGCSRMGLTERPTTIAGKQAAAAVGQVRLMALYDDMFSVLGARCAQVLLTYDTFGERTQYLNARNTFAELLRLGAVPVVNENDTVAVQELRVGDNDTLSALVAAMVGAAWLFLLTDVECLYTANPRAAPDAAPIRVVPPAHIQGLRRQMLEGVVPLVVGAGAPSAGDRKTQQTAPVAAGAAANSNGTSHGSGPKPTLSQSHSPGRQHTGAGAAGKGAGPSPPAAVGTPATAGSAAPAAAAAAAAAAVTAGGSKGGTNAAAGAAGSQWGTGGMVTKLKAAQLATAAGVTVIITASAQLEAADRVLVSLRSSGSPSPSTAASVPGASGNNKGSSNIFIERGLGTTFLPSPVPATGRKRWILSLATGGAITLDAGATAAVVEARKSLFPAGIVAVAGDFEPQDAVQLLDAGGREVARALVNYSASDCRRIRGHRSKDVAALLGYNGVEQVCDRDNIVILHYGDADANADDTPAAASDTEIAGGNKT